MTQVHASHPERHEEPDNNVGDLPKPDTAKAEKLKHDIDDILDEIDDVLEENADEFVRQYVQKGGQ